MKLVKGISLFIVLIGIFICGCFLGNAYNRFFYPGASAKQQVQVAQVKKQVITADTEYIVVSIDEGGNKKEVQDIPAQYIGMNLNAFSQAIESLNSAPALSELNKGFQGAEIHSFSREKVELYKYYSGNANNNTEEYYYLAIQNGNVVVYLSDEKTLYMETGINAEFLPEDIVFDLLQKRVVNTQGLYDFLESYSS